MPDPQLPNPIIVPEVPGGAGGINVDPATGQPTPTSPDIQPSGELAPSTTTQPTGQKGTDPLPVAIGKWLGALVLLWIILTALAEYSDNGAIFAKALAGLILFGALYYLGPQAMSNIKNIWSK
jgi:hypothetical protein